ncbi:MAG TPA: NADH-quinone oxidoreductase subunit C [Elusimicrobiota bacterium]|nr:NADH-quinone oxidoreductase subunit C [Elusimicrobiota bacterium]
MDDAQLVERIAERFGEAREVPLPDPKWLRPDAPQVKVPAERVAEVARYLKNELGFDLLDFLTAVDWLKENRFEMVYCFTKTAEPKSRLFLKADLPREGEPGLPSLAGLYKAADWQEREVFDLFGIRFEGHPHLKRILLWEGYPGHPLRKDYVHVPDKYDNGSEIGLPKSAVPSGEHK